MPALIAFVTELIITGTVEDLVNKGGLAEMVLGWELVVRTSLENFSELEHIDKQGKQSDAVHSTGRHAVPRVQFHHHGELYVHLVLHGQ